MKLDSYATSFPGIKKKERVQAETPPHPPPHHFSNGPSVSGVATQTFLYLAKCILRNIALINFKWFLIEPRRSQTQSLHKNRNRN